MNWGHEKERRKAVRRRVYKGAKISFRGLRATIDCVVRDYSDSGARLGVESPVGIPDNFELIRADLPPVMCRVIWRKTSQIGVAFIKLHPARISGNT